MTDEQKQKYKEFEKRYRENMTDDKNKNKEIIKKNTEKT